MPPAPTETASQHFHPSLVKANSDYWTACNQAFFDNDVLHYDLHEWKQGYRSMEIEVEKAKRRITDLESTRDASNQKADRVIEQNAKLVEAEVTLHEEMQKVKEDLTTSKQQERILLDQNVRLERSFQDLQHWVEDGIAQKLVLISDLGTVRHLLDQKTAETNHLWAEYGEAVSHLTASAPEEHDRLQARHDNAVKGHEDFVTGEHASLLSRYDQLDREQMSTQRTASELSKTNSDLRKDLNEARDAKTAAENKSVNSNKLVQNLREEVRTTQRDLEDERRLKGKTEFTLAEERKSADILRVRISELESMESGKYAAEQDCANLRDRLAGKESECTAKELKADRAQSASEHWQKKYHDMAEEMKTLEPMRQVLDDMIRKAASAQVPDAKRLSEAQATNDGPESDPDALRAMAAAATRASPSDMIEEGEVAADTATGRTMLSPPVSEHEQSNKKRKRQERGDDRDRSVKSRGGNSRR